MGTGRSQSILGEASSLLGYWGVPLSLATDNGFVALGSEQEILATAQQQLDGMLAAAYDHSDVLEDDVILMNARCALYRAEFSRCSADGNEISRFTASYLLTDGSAGRRISALVVHS
jgi:hypothetical protein